MPVERLVIKSKENKTYKYISSLKTKKGRDFTGTFAVEGAKLAAEAAEYCGVEILAFSQSYFIRHGESVCTEKVFAGAETIVFADSLFSALCDTETAQGILAVCRKKEWTLHEALENPEKSPLYVLLEEIGDPGNLGAIIRAADAAGASAVFLSGGCADMYSPKVLRAAAGSAFHLPIVENVDLISVVFELKNHGVLCAAAHLKGALYPYGIDLTRGAAFIIGNEARGLSMEITKAADVAVKIPIRGRAESLNAAVACGVLLYEAVRQLETRDQGLEIQ